MKRKKTTEQAVRGKRKKQKRIKQAQTLEGEYQNENTGYFSASKFSIFSH